MFTLLKQQFYDSNPQGGHTNLPTNLSEDKVSIMTNDDATREQHPQLPHTEETKNPRPPLCAIASRGDRGM